ncbi:MAG: type II secretion system protein [Candidatus Omnitrophota bacterium]
MKLKIRKEKGFILLEILISIVVFSAGILFLVQSLSMIIKSNKKLIANSYAYNTIDNLLNRLQVQGLELVKVSGNNIAENLNWQINLNSQDEWLKEIVVEIYPDIKINEKKYSFSYISINPEIIPSSF